MDDDKKRPAGDGGKGRGPRKPAAGKTGGRNPFAAKDRPGKPRPQKREAAGGETTGEAARPKRPFPARGGEEKPFRRQDGDKRPFRKRDEGTPGEEGARPKRSFSERRSGEKPFTRQDGDKRPYTRRDRDEGPSGEAGARPKRPFSDREGEEKPFRRQDGAKRAFAKREDGRPPRPARPGKREREEQRVIGEAGGEDGGGAGERIARRLARAGISSRRDAEEMIAAGRVKLNGKVLDTPAVNVSDRDRIEVDDQPIPATERTRLFLFHKPAGVVTTSRDPEGRRTVFDILPAGLPRLMTVGRLDINTEGLLLLTNDGGLARMLELPATGWLRRYRVRVHGKVELAALEALKDGIAVDGTFYGSIEASLDREQGSNAWLTIGLREGKNREVKNVLGALGLDVTRLIRVSFGPFQLGELAEGEVRELRGRTLREQLGERLIAEAGADFDAPVLNEFSNKPVSAREEKRPGPREERPNRKREREQKREDALGRLDTRKPPRGAGKKPFGRDDRPERGESPAGPPRSRTSNVWMAPGAKPLGEKKKAELAARNEGKRYAGKPKPAGGGKGGPRGGPGGGRPAAKPGPRGPRGGR